MDKHPVTPAPVVPTRELLGELLLELNQPRKPCGNSKQR